VTFEHPYGDAGDKAILAKPLQCLTHFARPLTRKLCDPFVAESAAAVEQFQDGRLHRVTRLYPGARVLDVFRLELHIEDLEIEPQLLRAA